MRLAGRTGPNDELWSGGQLETGSISRTEQGLRSRAQAPGKSWLKQERQSTASTFNRPKEGPGCRTKLERERGPHAGRAELREGKGLPGRVAGDAQRPEAAWSAQGSLCEPREGVGESVHFKRSEAGFTDGSEDVHPNNTILCFFEHLSDLILLLATKGI